MCIKCPPAIFSIFVKIPKHIRLLTRTCSKMPMDVLIIPCHFLGFFHFFWICLCLTEDWYKYCMCTVDEWDNSFESLRMYDDFFVNNFGGILHFLLMKFSTNYFGNKIASISFYLYESTFWEVVWSSFPPKDGSQPVLFKVAGANFMWGCINKWFQWYAFYALYFFLN